ncbi:MAG: twin-arginine translocase subunit TatC [Acidobacteriaceae bacterium]|nr:twin-arginine translocase subunit TatC [Acidobacteriaceae bacterium]
MFEESEDHPSANSSSVPENQEPAAVSSPDATAPVYSSSSAPYGVEPEEPTAVSVPPKPVQTLASQKPPPPPPPPPPSDDDEGDEEEAGMLRMSFMEHLEELRSRLIRAILGLVVAFIASMFFAKELWRIVQEPATTALQHLHVNPPDLAQITPMEGFNIIWLKMPLLVSIFIGSPWVLYQVWAFISPGLYRREKRWAVPFIVFTAGLFITGGLFAYFVVFRYGLEFLLGIGLDVNVRPVVSITEYFDLFVNVTLGVGLVFEMPVIIFFLTLLRLASPRFLLKHSRYAILAITIIAAIVTPTPDVFNMMIFAVPMVALYFVGIAASYLLVLRREGKRMPWRTIGLVLLALVLVAAGTVAIFVYRYHFHLVSRWPFLTR